IFICSRRSFFCRRRPRPPPFPYTPLFRSRGRRARPLPPGRLRPGRVTAVSSLPADVAELIGKVQYEETGEFPVERGYIWTGNSPDRKSTRLNSSHLGISYAVFCLKKRIRR